MNLGGPPVAERRRRHRANVQFRIHFRSGVLEGRATLADLSTKGARLEDASTQPQLGAEVELEIELEPLPVIVVEGFAASVSQTARSTPTLSVQRRYQGGIWSGRSISVSNRSPSTSEAWLVSSCIRGWR